MLLLNVRIVEKCHLKNYILKRCKHAGSRSKKNSASYTSKALKHFDDFYQQVFTKNWPGIREGLISKQKYVAVVNNFSDSEKIQEQLENIGALNIRRLFDLEKQYMHEDNEKNKRRKRLERIWAMDKITDNTSEPTQIATNSEKQSLNVGSRSAWSEPYPTRDVEPLQSQVSSVRNEFENMHDTVEYDTSRIIDTENSSSLSTLYEYMPATKIKGKEDWIPESTHYKYYSNSEFPIKIEKQSSLHFPEHLNVYTYEMENTQRFREPGIGSTGVYDYYLMDGGSLLPVLALDLKPGCNILDMCAAPGGKSLLTIQTLYPNFVVCNDVSTSRTNRIFNVMKQFLYDFNMLWLDVNKLRITSVDGRTIEDKCFNRILVDVPCTTDRRSVTVEDNNIFKPSRITERLKLPELQCALLVRALKLVEVGGVVVYSTCSLSPIQNDGVVHMALKQIWEETKLEIVVHNMSSILPQMRSVYKFAGNDLMKYGHLIIPNVHSNFGPTYFCKLQRLK